MSDGLVKTRALRAVTRCATLEEFIAGYGRLAGEDTIFVVTRAPRPPGPPRPFVVQLSDGSTVLRGIAEVIESHSLPTGPDGQCGMRLRIVEMDAQSREVHKKLLAPARKAAPPAVPHHVPPEGTAPWPPLPERLPSPPTGPTPRFEGGPETTVDRAPSFRPPPSPTPTPTPAPSEQEQRTPGSPYILPANPLYELPAEALEHFVECTLYEHTDMIEFATPEPERGKPIPVLPPSYSSPPPRSYPGFGPNALPLPPDPARWRRIAYVGIAVAATVGLAGGWLLRGGNPETVSARAPTAAHVVEAATPPPSPAPSPPPPPSPSPPPPPSPSPAPSTASVPICRARITTDTADVRVRWNRLDLGATPLDVVTVPCGPATVVLTHPRRLRAERRVTATADEVLQLAVTLPRADVKLSLRSLPAGATFSIDGAPVGKAPTIATVKAFTSVTIVAELPGFKPWRGKVYVKANQPITARLERKR